MLQNEHFSTLKHICPCTSCIINSVHACIESLNIFFDYFKMDILNQNVRASCQLCFFHHADPKKVIIHMLAKHKGDASFTVKCVVADFMYMTKTWTAYR